MYESFYNLSAKPFSLLPDADFLFMSKRHRRVVNLLEYNSETKAGFMVLTGDVGAGKTTVIRHYLKNLSPDIVVGTITNSSKSLGRLLQWVAMAFSLNNVDNDDVKIYNEFVEFLLKQYAAGKSTLLIIDEAQNLSNQMLEDLRMLSNVNNEKDQLLQIVLVGQPELLETLKRDDLRQFVQRISVHCHLIPLTAEETAAYIKHRMGVVGGAKDVFDDMASAAVYYFTGGVPRLINLLCDHALMYAFADDRKFVTHTIIEEVVMDRNSGGLSAFRELPPEHSKFALVLELQDIARKLRLAQAEGVAT